MGRGERRGFSTALGCGRGVASHESSPLAVGGHGAWWLSTGRGGYTLKRTCMMSPSATTYSLPSTWSFPASFTPASEPYSMNKS